MEKITFTCEKCSKEITMTKYCHKGINICKTCKTKQTNIAKYGVDSPAKNKEIMTQIKQTNIEKYGVAYSFQAEEVKEKIKRTNLERFGFENVSQAQETKDKIYLHNKKNNYINFVNRIKNNWYVITTEEEYQKQNFREEPLKIKCKVCNIEKDFFNIHGSSYLPFCRICNKEPIGGSFEEDDLYNFISSIYHSTIERRKKIDNQEIDIFIPEKNIGFEYNGMYWHSETSGGKNKNYHLNKQNKMKENNIELFHIFSCYWLHKPTIIKSILASKFGVYENKYFARKCEIKEIDSETSTKFINENHLQGNVNASIRIALYYENKLVSITTFGRSRFSNEEYELYRFCNKINTHVVGGFSKMFAYFVKTYNPKSIITYSEKMLFNNNTYENSGFKYIEDTEPNYYYIKKYSSGFVETRMKYQKHKLPELLDKFDPTLTEWENMVANKYDRIWDCGNRKFIWKQ